MRLRWDCACWAKGQASIFLPVSINVLIFFALRRTNVAPSVEDLESAVQMLGKCAAAWRARRWRRFRETQFQIQLGKCVAAVRFGVEATARHMAEIWEGRMAIWPYSAVLGVAISAALCTEASAERSFFCSRLDVCSPSLQHDR